MFKHVTGWLIATLLLLVLGTGCEKDIVIDDLSIPVVNGLRGEARHTDSLLRTGTLKLGEPDFVTRHPGDDHTYDIYYGRDTVYKPGYAGTKREYILANKWTVTYMYMNSARTCGTILLWHNAKSVQLIDCSLEVYNQYTQWQQVKGIDLIKLLDEKPN